MTLAPRKLWQEITLPYHPHHTSTTWTALLTYRGKRYLKTLYYRWSPSMMTPKMGYNCGQFRNNNKTSPEKIVKCSHKLYKYLQQKIYETDPALFAGSSSSLGFSKMSQTSPSTKQSDFYLRTLEVREHSAANSCIVENANSFEAGLLPWWTSRSSICYPIKLLL